MVTESVALLSWVNKVLEQQGVSAVSSLHELADCVALHQILETLDPFFRASQFYGSDAISQRKENCVRFLKELSQFFVDELGVEPPFDWTAFISPADMAAASERHISAAIELVLAIAVQTELRESSIETILDMDEAVQEVLMAVVQNHLQGGSGEYSNGSVEAVAAYQLGDAEHVSPPHAPSGDLQATIVALTAERDVLAAQLEEAQSSNGQVDHALARKHAELRQEHDDLLDKFYDEHAAREEASADIEELKETVARLSDERDTALAALEAAHEDQARPPISEPPKTLPEPAAQSIEAIEEQQARVVALEAELERERAGSSALIAENTALKGDLEAHSKALSALKQTMVAQDSQAADRSRAVEDESLLVCSAFQRYVLDSMRVVGDHSARAETGLGWWARLRADK
ncbi:Calponin [Carpediemonas membranifera]|uniref:Calponin n=1 Tax=Carpediemonas membranifera TaxID=201153 RepID=A0A8J6E0G5_9EUKA|nr:Calponin [Carpediemonas membranifera]|eukprot:KAG9395094.1 Calponin [Carpediemonas membranifera]